MRSLMVVCLVACSKKDPAPAPPPPPAAPVVVAIDAAASPDASAPDAAAPGDASSGKLADAEHETIGGFALGASSDDVVKALGPPVKKSKEETMAATGETVATWSWHGLEITMAKQDAKYTVNAIGVKPPSTAATSRGIHLGSTRAEVEASYERTKEDHDADGKSLLVGSVYGGELFTFKDGKLVEIFLGQMAE